MNFPKLRMRNIPNDSGCSQDLCQCEFYAEIANNFAPLHFGSYNPKYESRMYRADGTECGCDEFSMAGMYNKLPRNCDMGPFDNGVHVKLPPNKIIWEPDETISAHHPVCKALKPYSRGVLGPFSHIKLFLKHHYLNKIYRQPTDLDLCKNQSKPTART